MIKLDSKKQISLLFLSFFIISGFAVVYAEETNCTDSDGGYDIFTHGICKSSHDTFTDACVSDNALMEYRCENNSCKTGGAEYGGVCPAGYICSKSASACVNLSIAEDCQMYKKLYIGYAKDMDGKLVVEYTSSSTANLEIKLQMMYSAYGVEEENETVCAVVSEQCENEGGAVLITGLENFQCTVVTDCNYPTLEGYSSEYQYYAKIDDKDCPKVSDKKYITPTYNYCEDYDKGLNYYVRSQIYTYGSDPTLYDCCVDAEGGACKRAGLLLTERYCESKKPKNFTYSCPNGCKDGACIVLEGEKPDLIVENISLEYNSNKSGNPAYVYTVYVKNAGNAPATLSYLKTTISPEQPRIMEKYIYERKREEGGNYYMYNGAGANIPNNDLASGELLPPGWSERFTDYFNPSQDGEVTVSAQADTENRLDELNENNNNASKTFTVTKVFDVPTHEQYTTPIAQPCHIGECGPTMFSTELSPSFYQTIPGKWETFLLKIKDTHQSGNYTYKILAESSGGYSAYDMPLALLPLFMSSSAVISPQITCRLISSVASSGTSEQTELLYMTATPKIAISSTTAPIPSASTIMPTSFNSTSVLKFNYKNETEIGAGSEKTVEIKVMSEKEGIYSFKVVVSATEPLYARSKTTTAALIAKQQSGYCGTGCLYNFNCIPFGSRIIVNGKNVYCSILSGQMEMQMETDAECQNDYECLSNSCVEGRCRKMYSLMEQLWNWLRSAFGIN